MLLGNKKINLGFLIPFCPFCHAVIFTLLLFCSSEFPTLPFSFMYPSIFWHFLPLLSVAFIPSYLVPLSSSLCFSKYHNSITIWVAEAPGCTSTVITRGFGFGYHSWVSRERKNDGEQERNQRRSPNYLSLHMEVFLLLWSAICRWSHSSTVWVWKQSQHWVINVTKCFPNVVRDWAGGWS